MPDMVTLIASVSTLVVAISVLVVSVGIFYLIVRLGRAIEMMAGNPDDN